MGTESAVFPDDSVSRNMYSLFQGTATSSPTGATPQFLGNMNAYRIDNKTLNANIQTILGSYVQSQP